MKTLLSAPTLQDPEILQQINNLRQTDNFTNWYYLAREYTFVALVIAFTIVCLEAFWDGPWSLLWAAPLTMVAIILVGAAQHRIGSFTHEAAHYMLFKNRV